MSQLVFLLLGDADSALDLEDEFQSSLNAWDGLSQSLCEACEEELNLTPCIVKEHYVKVSAADNILTSLLIVASFI